MDWGQLITSKQGLSENSKTRNRNHGRLLIHNEKVSILTNYYGYPKERENTIWVHICNTQKFTPFWNRWKFNLIGYFCAHENIRKIIFFIKLKFIISLSNVVVHTCWHIRFDVMFACCSFMCWVRNVFKICFWDRSSFFGIYLSFSTIKFLVS